MAVAEVQTEMVVTKRQLSLLAMHAEGKTFYEIAGQSFVSYGTVRCDLDRLRRQLEARNLTHALVLAVSRGFLCIDGRSGRAFVPEQIPFDDIVISDGRGRETVVSGSVAA